MAGLAQRILHSIYGSRLGLTLNGGLVLDGHLKVPGYRDPGAVFRLFDHFEGNTLSTRFITKKGSDGSCAFPAHSDNKSGGRCLFTTGADAGATIALNGSQLLGARQFDVGQAAGSVPVSFAAAFQVSRITDVSCFIGFGDQDSALQAPFTLAAGVLTSNATDGFGFLFDTGATAATIKLVGVANDVDAAVIDTGLALVAATDKLFLIEHDGTTAKFYIDGVLVGALTGCSRAAHNLAPTVEVFSLSAVSLTAQLDYLSVEQSR